MKRFLIGTVILALVTIGAFAQNAAYKENLEKAKSFESQKKWVNALASYYDAMAAEPNEKAEEAYKAYTKLADTIKAGMPGYGEMDVFAIYDGWMAIAGEWENYWKENCPICFKCSTIEKGELDMETRTGSYNASLTYSYTSKYRELYDVVFGGWGKAYRSEWKGCSENSLKLTDNPRDRNYRVGASVLDETGKVVYNLTEKEPDYYFLTNYNWEIKNISRDMMNRIDTASYIVKPTGVSWIVNGKNNSYNLSKVEIITVNGVPSPNVVYLVKTFILEFVEGGTFQMGSTNGNNDEKPIHDVTVFSFYIGKTEVTQAQWKAVMGNNPSYFKGDMLPVETVSWYDAIVFCNKLSIKNGKIPVYMVDGETNPDSWDYTPCQGKSISTNIEMNLKSDGYRLPTEAEWEYAARGGKKSKGYEYSGSGYLGSVAWYKTNSDGKTHDVAMKEPNELEIYDMSGNVFEWCWDWYDSNYYNKSPSKNPTGPSSGMYRVGRGGSWYEEKSGWVYDDSYFHKRIAYRTSEETPSERFSNFGFRIVCSSSEMVAYITEQERLEQEKIENERLERERLEKERLEQERLEKERLEKERIAREKQKVVDNLLDSFIYVEGGQFKMGNTSYEKDEKPVHNVTLSSFYVTQTEITQEQWRVVMDSDPSLLKGDTLPVENVSWYDAIVFCNKFSKMVNMTPVYSLEGKTDPDEWNYTPCQGGILNGTISMNINANGYRLPTESEWEYAARGGKKSKGYKYSGSNKLKEVAWYVENSDNETQKLRLKKSNELLLYDMSGNVREWCWDLYGSYTKELQKDPTGSTAGSFRIWRGGSFNDFDVDCRVTKRGHANANESSNNLGFRLVRSAN